MRLSAVSDGDSKVVLTFDSPLDPTSAGKAENYRGTPNLFIQSATLQGDNRQVVRQTSPSTRSSTPSSCRRTSRGKRQSGQPGVRHRFVHRHPTHQHTERPKVTSAASTSNKSVVVQFSKPMSDSTADPSRFAIVQTVVHPEVGAMTISGAEFVGTDRLSVKLTTLSMAEVTYQVTVNNVTDLAGLPLADKTNVAGVIVDPTSFTFPGTPPAYIPCPPNAPSTCVDIDERVNSDDPPGDTLYDHEETRGWTVTIYLANGDTQIRQVTSNPFSVDTDNDGLKDHEERALNIDPRDDDTDDDGLTDWAEFNEFYSDPTKQDSDSDGLYDGLEVNTFRTSPIQRDTAWSTSRRPPDGRWWWRR